MLAATNKIDLISTSAEGEVELSLIVERGEWGDSRRRWLLQEKLNTYAAYALDGQMLRDYPDLAGRRVLIKIIATELTPSDILALLPKFETLLAGDGITMKLQPRHPAPMELSGARRNDVLALAGVALSHALWSICDGSPLCTLALLEGDAAPVPDAVPVGRHRMDLMGVLPATLLRFEADSIEQSIRQAHRLLHAEPHGDRLWALAWDGYLTHEGARLDAIFVELPDGAMVAQRYQPRTLQSAFGAVGQPLYLHDGQTGEFPADLLVPLQRGIEAHRRACRAVPAAERIPAHPAA